MPTCRAPLPGGHACNTPLFVCATCGHRGCRNEECRNQGFERGFPRCFACGATSGIRTV